MLVYEIHNECECTIFIIQCKDPNLMGINTAGNCEGSLGAASLGANRDAPLPRMTSSVRSDERPLATQGDMLNSIKV